MFGRLVAAMTSAAKQHHAEVHPKTPVAAMSNALKQPNSEQALGSAELDQAQELTRKRPPTCTYCGSKEFFSGPEGGMSMNVKCANPECRHKFNLIYPTCELVDLHSVEPTPEERAEIDKKALAAADARLQSFVDDGAAIYRRGGTLVEAWRLHNSPELAMSGFLHAMILDVHSEFRAVQPAAPPRNDCDCFSMGPSNCIVHGVRNRR